MVCLVSDEIQHYFLPRGTQDVCNLITTCGISALRISAIGQTGTIKILLTTLPAIPGTQWYTLSGQWLDHWLEIFAAGYHAAEGKCVSSSIWNMPHVGYTQNALYTEKWPYTWYVNGLLSLRIKQQYDTKSSEFSVDISLPKNRTEKAGPSPCHGNTLSLQTCLHWTLTGSFCAEIASLDTLRMTSLISGTNNFLDKMAWDTKGKDILISCFTADGLLFTKLTWC